MTAGTDSTDEDYVRRALALAQRAQESNEVPVGALVVIRGKVVGEGWNQPCLLYTSSLAFIQLSGILKGEEPVARAKARSR